MSHDGRTLAAASLDARVVKLYEIPTGTVIATIDGETGQFSQDGRWFASALRDSLHVWDRTTGKVTATFDGFDARFSADSRNLAVGGDRQISLVDLPALHRRTVLAAPPGAGTFKFSPDGHWLSSHGPSKVVRVWDVTSGTLRAALGHDDLVSATALSPDGAWLASGAGCTIRLWHLGGGRVASCFFDPEALDEGRQAVRITGRNEYGQEIVTTLPCGAPIPPGAICTCNCVPGTHPRPTTPTTDSFCTCNKVCVCVPVFR